MQAERTSEFDLASQIKTLLESLRQPALAPFLEDWPHRHRTRGCVAGGLPVLRWLTQIDADGAAFARGLVAALCRAAASLAWRQTYAAQDVGRVFLDNYGWTEIIGGTGPLAAERIACGFLILGPGTHYPRHRHEAEEMYLPLSGTAAWQQGDAVWREHPPGTLIHHAGDEPHAMRTGADALLALYLWRGTHIAGKARLEHGTA
jgi:hypothetical protein